MELKLYVYIVYLNYKAKRACFSPSH